jgi:methylmalonyl-CoA/ethylmalonyl-CoA epimerase
MKGRSVDMLGIRRFDHVSMATRDLERQIEFFRNLFGMEVAERFRNVGEGFAGAALRVPGSSVRLEVLAPAGEGGFLGRFLEAGGSALHHLTFEVEDIERAAEALRRRGIEPFRRRAGPGWQELFIHPRDSGGVLIQLYAYAADRVGGEDQPR